jgi:hypothetical protein
MSLLPVSYTTHNATMTGIGKFTTTFTVFLILISLYLLTVLSVTVAIDHTH